MGPQLADTQHVVQADAPSASQSRSHQGRVPQVRSPQVRVPQAVWSEPTDGRGLCLPDSRLPGSRLPASLPQGPFPAGWRLPGSLPLGPLPV